MSATPFTFFILHRLGYNFHNAWKIELAKGLPLLMGIRITAN